MRHTAHAGQPTQSKAVAKPTGVTEDEHATHHSAPLVGAKNTTLEVSTIIASDG